MGLQRLPLADAEVALDPYWLDAGEADRLFIGLRDGIVWETHTIRLFGRELASPRLSCWIGDPGTRYRYSGIRHERGRGRRPCGRYASG